MKILTDTPHVAERSSWTAVEPPRSLSVSRWVSYVLNPFFVRSTPVCRSNTPLRGVSLKDLSLANRDAPFGLREMLTTNDTSFFIFLSFAVLSPAVLTIASVETMDSGISPLLSVLLFAVVYLLVLSVVLRGVLSSNFRRLQERSLQAQRLTEESPMLREMARRIASGEASLEDPLLQEAYYSEVRRLLRESEELRRRERLSLESELRGGVIPQDVVHSRRA